MSVASDGYLYFTSSQLHRQPSYHNGGEKPRKSYYWFRVKIDAAPVRLCQVSGFEIRLDFTVARIENFRESSIIGE